MASLQVEGLSKTYGTTKVVDGVALNVENGEFVVLLGPSGCGKTTTLRMIAGFVEATGGKIIIGGKDVTQEPPYRRNIGLVFQNYALFPHLSVFENAAFGLRRRKLPEPEIKAKVERALALVRLHGLAERFPRQLSGGQQQRVAIARALVIEPDILLLDEPLSNLDAQLRLEVRSELRRLQKTLGITTIMVTHDQEEAMGVADRLVVLQSGRVQQIGSAREIYRTPANRFVAGFIGRGNFLSGKIISARDPSEGTSIFRTTEGTDFSCQDGVPQADTLLVRPEHVVMAPDTEPGLRAEIENILFQGSALDIELRLSNGENILAEVPALMRTLAADWQVGQRVSVQIEQTAMILLQSAPVHAD